MFLKLSLRKIVQILSLILFLLFIYTTRLDSNLKLSLDFWLSLDPLAGLILPIASKELIGTLGPVIIIYLVTLLAGRFFCGWICPLGTTLDGLGTMARYKKKPSPTVAKKPRFFKYALLTALIFLAVLGLNLAFLASPLPLASRLYALIFYPLLEIGLEHLPINYLESWPYLELEPHLFNSAWITGLLWVAFFILERLRPRFWCRYLCPAGALLGVLAKFAPFRLQVLATSCTSCSQCAKNCPLGTDPRKNYSECIVCLKCQ
ncbi:MAG: 4Fe-4S binding protein, partial [Desulfovibrionaceae bacterium]|nr:4Fe-4S binding protein [Desulfovibrionaceae bacterium]